MCSDVDNLTCIKCFALQIVYHYHHFMHRGRKQCIYNKKTKTQRFFGYLCFEKKNLEKIMAFVCIYIFLCFVLSWIMDFNRPWINKVIAMLVEKERAQPKIKNGSSFTDNMSRWLGNTKPLKFSFHCYHLLLKFICLEFLAVNSATIPK